MGFFDVFTLLAAVFIGGYLLYQVYLWLRRRSAAKYITQEDFRDTMRKAQVIDVRNKDEFNRKHILGARNIPYGTKANFKQRVAEIRKDQPIYLYDQYIFEAGKAASVLKSEGFTNIYILKDGIEGWTGKVKEVKPTTVKK